MKSFFILIVVLLFAFSLNAQAFDSSSKADSISQLFKLPDKGAATVEIDEAAFRRFFINKFGERIVLSGTFESRSMALQKKLRIGLKAKHIDVSKLSPLEVLEWLEADLKNNADKYTANDLGAVYRMVIPCAILASSLKVVLESDPVKLSKAHLRHMLEITKSVCKILELPDEYWKELDGLRQ